ncbi:MAG: CoA transferase [Burkholderiaceae bacterium]|nr:CoA transferase [Burkholderiaceae bacterium]
MIESTVPVAAPTGPLAGVRVLDLTSVVLGPVATQVLADFGADVIKIEGPQGDLMRRNGVSLHPKMSSIFLTLNRNKRSVCIDLKRPEGAAAMRRLVAGADVLVHNMRVQAIERLGFGYAEAAAMNPRIVYCVATGFGQDGPDRDRPAFDDIIQSASGMVDICSRGRDAPDFVPSLIADKTTGMALANAVLAALFHRERSGQGQYVEVPMLETMAAFVLAEHLGGLTFRPAPPDAANDGAPTRAGYARLLEGGRRPYRTADGWIALLPYTDRHWQAFFEGARRPDLLAWMESADRSDRNVFVRALYAHLREIMPTRTSAEWLATCDALDVPATRIYGIDELPEHPHLKAVGFFQDAEHPTEGAIRQMRPPTRFSATPASIRSPAPRLGQHTAEVLREAGLGDAEITALTGKADG